MIITFQKLNETHFPLMLKWLTKSHVKKWWDPDITYNEELIREKYNSYIEGYKIINKSHKQIESFIINLNNNPVGYIQIYNACDFYKNHVLLKIFQNLGAFDIFIGAEEYLGQNLGSKVILKFIDLHGKKYSNIFVDPDIQNIAAIKCYKKAGFAKIIEQSDDSVLWMIKSLVSVNNKQTKS